MNQKILFVILTSLIFQFGCKENISENLDKPMNQTENLAKEKAAILKVLNDET